MPGLRLLLVIAFLLFASLTVGGRRRKFQLPPPGGLYETPFIRLSRPDHAVAVVPNLNRRVRDRRRVLEIRHPDQVRVGGEFRGDAEVGHLDEGLEICRVRTSHVVHLHKDNAAAVLPDHLVEIERADGDRVSFGPGRHRLRPREFLRLLAERGWREENPLFDRQLLIILPRELLHEGDDPLRVDRTHLHADRVHVHCGHGEFVGFVPFEDADAGPCADKREIRLHVEREMLIGLQHVPVHIAKARGDQPRVCRFGEDREREEHGLLRNFILVVILTRFERGGGREMLQKVRRRYPVGKAERNTGHGENPVRIVLDAGEGKVPPCGESETVRRRHRKRSFPACDAVLYSHRHGSAHPEGFFRLQNHDLLGMSNAVRCGR